MNYFLDRKDCPPSHTWPAFKQHHGKMMAKIEGKIEFTREPYVWKYP